MTDKSPMSYFVDSKKSKNTKITNNKSKTKPSVALNKLSKHKILNDYINSISGYPSVSKKFKKWGEQDALYKLRTDAGLNVNTYLPEIIVITGKGDTYQIVKHMANFFKKAEMSNTNNIASYDINKFIKHYVTDFEKEIDDAFRNSRSSVVDIYGLNGLIANPRPSIADWHDWVDIIIPKLLDNIDKARFMYPVFLTISKSNWDILTARYPRLSLYKTGIIQSNYLDAANMASMIMNRLKKRNFIVPQPLKKKLEALVTNTLCQKDIRKLSENMIRLKIHDDIINRQGRRIESNSASLTSRKIKTIIKNDIPSQIILADNKNIIFY